MGFGSFGTRVCEEGDDLIKSTPRVDYYVSPSPYLSPESPLRRSAIPMSA